ncbi:MAG: hypothetical protein ACRDTU_10605, partial [Micromonosporaceae bacterium]
MTRLRSGFAVVVLLTTVAVANADQPLRRPGPVSSVDDLGPIRWDRRILGRDGGMSARWKDTTIWVFGDTFLNVPGADGDRFADNTSAVTRDLDANDGVSLVPPKGLEHPDGAHVPGEYLPFSDTERAFNDRNDPHRCGTPQLGDCGTQYFLWPGPVVPDPARDRILFFLTTGRRGGAIEGFSEWGSSIAVWDAATRQTTRPPGGTTFGPDETPYATMALTVGDTLYAYGCDHRGMFVFDCRLARVPLDRALSRDAWRFYAGHGRWSPERRAAVRVFQGGHAGSVFYNRHLGQYQAVYGYSTAYYRTAPHPWGPWS